MNPLSERFKKEWAFFINPKTQKIQYNEKCTNCIQNDCKQSYRVKVVFCSDYKKKEVSAK